jgi:ribosomal protein S14
MSKRQTVTSHELLRRAFKFVARNTTLPFRIRHQAQLQLNQFPAKSRPVQVKERCTETGRGRGVMTEFGLCRVSTAFFFSLFSGRTQTDPTVPRIVSIQAESFSWGDTRCSQGLVVILPMFLHLCTLHTLSVSRTRNAAFYKLFVLLIAEQLELIQRCNDAVICF